MLGWFLKFTGQCADLLDIGGVMVDVIQEIPPSPEFAERYLP